MTITNKDSILKKYYELNGQQTLFGYDNLEFKIESLFVIVIR